VGREALAAARPIHVAAVRKHLLRHLGEDEAEIILRLARRVESAS
jgi:hypothetical protein